MSLATTLKSLLAEVTWSERPVWVSPPLRGTRFRRGKHVNRLWLDPELKQPPADKVYLGLGTIDVSHIPDRPGSGPLLPSGGPAVYQAEDCGNFLAHCLGLPSFENIEAAGEMGRQLRLDLAITDMTPGFRLVLWLRQLPGWLNWTGHTGVGDARVQVEGILSDPRRRQDLLKFVVRRRAIRRWNWHLWLGWQPLRNPGSGFFDGIFAETMVGLLIRRAAYDVLMELDQRLNTR